MTRQQATPVWKEQTMPQNYARKGNTPKSLPSVLKSPSRGQSTRFSNRSEYTDFDPQEPPEELTRRNSNRTESTVSASTGYSGVSEVHRTSSFSSFGSTGTATRWAAKDILRVVHSAPLVLQDDAGRIQPVPALDLCEERKGLKSALEDTRVDVMFDFCTIGQLGKFLSQGRGKVLHYSGHGHAEQEANGEWGGQYLAIEDGWGKMHKMEVQDLADWIREGGNNLQLVFVSACHSRTAGDAFCKAGVEHVVCCKGDDLKIRNDIATEFTKGFYQSLANGKTISQAFDDGRNMAKNCSLVARAVARGEVEKIVLLPEDKKHDVKIFDPDEVPSNLPREYTVEEMQLLGESQGRRVSNRKPPSLFEGRQRDMYNILSALRQGTSIVRITGPGGVGKRSVVAGVCQYIQARKHIFKDDIDFLDWLVIDSESGEVDFSNQRLENFHEAQIIIIVDARKMKTEEQLGYVEHSLRDIISSTNARAIVIEPFDRPGKTKPFSGLLETEIHIEPLGFDPTLLLFARQCKFVGKDAAVKSIDDFRSTVVPDNVNQNELDTKIGRKFYARMGGGFPLQIQARARAITSKEEFEELIQLGLTHNMIQAWKQELQLHTRTDLDKLYMDLWKKMERARILKEYAQAEEWKIMLEELELMKEKLHDIPSLQQQAQQVEAALNRADDERHYAKANQLKIKLLDLTVKLQNEYMATTALRLAEYKAAKKYAENNALDCNLERLEELHQKYLEAAEAEAQFLERISMDSEGGGFYSDGSKIHPTPPEAKESMAIPMDTQFKAGSEEAARRVRIGNVPTMAPRAAKKRAKRHPGKQDVGARYPGSTCEPMERKRGWSNSHESKLRRNDERETHETSGRTVTGGFPPYRLVAVDSIANLGADQRNSTHEPVDDVEGVTGKGASSVSRPTASMENKSPFISGTNHSPHIGAAKGRLTHSSFPVKREHRKPTSDKPPRSAKGQLLKSSGQTISNQRAQPCIGDLPPIVPNRRRSRSPPLSPTPKNREQASDHSDSERETSAKHPLAAHQHAVKAQPFQRPPLRRQDPPGNYGQSRQRGGGVCCQLDNSTNNSVATSDIDTNATPLQIMLQARGDSLGDSLGEKQATESLGSTLLPIRVSDRSWQEVSQDSETFGSEKRPEKTAYELDGALLREPRERSMSQIEQSGAVASVDKKPLGPSSRVVAPPGEQKKTATHLIMAPPITGRVPSRRSEENDGSKSLQLASSNATPGAPPLPSCTNTGAYRVSEGQVERTPAFTGIPVAAEVESAGVEPAGVEPAVVVMAEIVPERKGLKAILGLIRLLFCFGKKE